LRAHFGFIVGGYCEVAEVDEFSMSKSKFILREEGQYLYRVLICKGFKWAVDSHFSERSSGADSKVE